MPIFKNHDAIFVHIPKTGGTTILRMFGLEEVNDFDIFYHQGEFFEFDHSTAVYLKSHIEDERWNNFYKFTLVRNPYERLVSEFFWKKKDSDKRIIDCSNIEFPDFIKFLYQNFDKILCNTHAEKSHFIRQIDFLLPEVEIFDLQNIDFLINKLMEKYNLNKPENIFNKTKHEHFDYYYDHSTKKMVYDMYYPDFEFLKYKK